MVRYHRRAPIVPRRVHDRHPFDHGWLGNRLMDGLSIVSFLSLQIAPIAGCVQLAAVRGTLEISRSWRGRVLRMSVGKFKRHVAACDELTRIDVKG